jgi:hypothetical protein
MSISIHQGPWRKIAAQECHGGNIVITGLAGGVGIFVYNATSHDTFCGHFPAPDAEHAEGLIEMLDQSMEDFRDSPLVNIYVTGCAEPDYEDWGRKGSERHRFVERELKKRHRANQQRDIRWPRQNVITSEMSLYPDSGEYGCGFRW